MGSGMPDRAMVRTSPAHPRPSPARGRGPRHALPTQERERGPAVARAAAQEVEAGGAVDGASPRGPGGRGGRRGRRCRRGARRGAWRGPGRSAGGRGCWRARGRIGAPRSRGCAKPAASSTRTRRASAVEADVVAGDGGGDRVVVDGEHASRGQGAGGGKRQHAGAAAEIEHAREVAAAAPGGRWPRGRARWWRCGRCRRPRPRRSRWPLRGSAKRARSWLPCTMKRPAAIGGSDACDSGDPVLVRQRSRAVGAPRPAPNAASASTMAPRAGSAS